MSFMRKEKKAGIIAPLIAAVMLVIVTCTACSEKDDVQQPEEDNAATVETSAPSEEATTPSQEITEDSEAAQPAEPEIVEPVEPEVTEEVDELTALYNNYKNQSMIDFTLALCELGYNEICLVDGDGYTTDYFSVKDGNYHTETNTSLILYVPFIPAEYSCDNENIGMYYWYEGNSDEKDRLINNIQLYCSDLEGEDVPVNISVTFEDGSTQEITVYLTHHIADE